MYYDLNRIRILTVYLRHFDLSGGTDSPHAARFAPNGDPLTHAEFSDFNRHALYGITHTRLFLACTFGARHKTCLWVLVYYGRDSETDFGSRS